VTATVSRQSAALAVVLAAALLVPRIGRSDPPPLWAPAVLDPLRLSSLPLSPADGLDLEPGRWRLEASVGYFNVQESTWHAPTLHRDLGLAGEPISAAEIAFIERAYPNDEVYLIDLEGWQVDLRASVGVGRGVVVSARLPWLEVGRPHWDDLAASVHDVLGAEKDGFEVFPYGQTVAYAFSGESRVERFDDIARSGFGDLTVAISGPLGRWLGAVHRWSAVVEAPTGDQGTVAGSGGWDLGLRWFGRWDLGNGRLLAAAGCSRLDPDGSWLGLERQDIWQLQIAYQHRLSDAWSLRVAIRGDSSPFADFDDSDLGATTLLFDLGLRRELGGQSWLGLTFGENLPQVGVTPDYTLQLQVGAVLGRGASGVGGVP
jgi:hypothetical protein